MIKKTSAVLILVCFLLSSFYIAPSTAEKSFNLMASKSITFSEPEINIEDNYLTVSAENSDSYIMDSGKPMLPYFTKTFTFPIGTKIESIDFIISDVKTKEIQGKIRPSPKAVSLNRITASNSNLVDKTIGEEDLTVLEDSAIYSSSELYPTEWFSYKYSCGLHEGKDTLFLSVSGYPVRYSPANNNLKYVEKMDIKVSYEEPKSLTSSEESDYDMVIIAPRKFKPYLQPLVRHKNNLMKVKTYIKTTEEIYDEFNGRDEPEQIKYFIKDAKEKQNIKYVLLVGGLKSFFNADDREHENYGVKDWYVPVRYTLIDYYAGPDSNESNENGTISDLYYSDLYRVNQSTQEQEFEDWDKNGNGRFAEYYEINNGEWIKDELDFHPDVYYGRLACRSILEVKIVVKKIIQYERWNHRYDPWYRTMIAIGGLTFRVHESGKPDGEYLCDLALDNMRNVIENEVRVYISNNGTRKPIPNAAGVITEFSKGAGFVLFQGHGGPHTWATKWEDGSWVGDFLTLLEFLLKNGRKLPIVVVGGCHNGMFNTTLIKSMRDNSTYWTYGVPTPECFSWRMCTVLWGGAITSTGCTGFGIGHPAFPETWSAELESDFFKYMGRIGKDNLTTVGDVFHKSIDSYVSEYYPMHFNDYYAVTIFQLFGDPSLKVGGR